MARVETREGTAPAQNAPEEEHLDEWFARRLESQGIPSRFGAPSLSRLTAVVALLLALGGLFWALSSVGPKSSSTSGTPAPPPKSGGQSTGTGGNGTGNTHPQTGKVSWRNVTVDVLNGFGGSGAAGTAADSLRAQGWKVGATGNATGIGSTEVVYLPGHKAEALAVTRKLGLPPPVKIADATGVVPSSTTGVAIVLGPDLLPTT
jgi:LytR cell envelope-related transcriptional attenuator